MMDAFPNETSQPSLVAHDVNVHDNKHVPVSILLDEFGNIVDCCQESERLFGFFRCELENQHISKLFPQLSEFQLLNNGHLNSLLDYLCHCGTTFLTQNRYGHIFNSELHFIDLMDHESIRVIRLIVSPFIGGGDELNFLSP
jgi:hypothetical protein